MARRGSVVRADRKVGGRAEALAPHSGPLKLARQVLVEKQLHRATRLPMWAAKS
jgi:hypothetical protein